MRLVCAPCETSPCERYENNALGDRVPHHAMWWTVAVDNILCTSAGGELPSFCRWVLSCLNSWPLCIHCAALQNGRRVLCCDSRAMVFSICVLAPIQQHLCQTEGSMCACECASARCCSTVVVATLFPSQLLDATDRDVGCNACHPRNA